MAAEESPLCLVIYVLNMASESVLNPDALHRLFHQLINASVTEVVGDAPSLDVINRLFHQLTNASVTEVVGDALCKTATYQLDPDPINARDTKG